MTTLSLGIDSGDDLVNFTKVQFGNKNLLLNLKAPCFETIKI